MKAIMIFVVVFIILIGVGIVVLYFFYERPTQRKIESSYVNFNILAKDGEQSIVTGYKVIVNGMLYSVGETLREGFVLERVPANSSVLVHNYNLKDQNYYTITRSKFTNDVEAQRVIFELKSPGKLNITQYGKLNGSPISLNISSINGDYKNLKFCIRWSIHLITVNIKDVILIDKVSNYSNYDRCYDTGLTITPESNYLLELDYKYFDNLDSQDFIKISFFDDDCVESMCFNEDERYKRRMDYEIRY